MKTRLLKRLRRRAFKQVKLCYFSGMYIIQWHTIGFEMLKWNVEKGLFLYGDYTIFNEREYSREKLMFFLWKAREKAVMNMFEEYKEKRINKEMKRL